MDEKKPDEEVAKTDVVIIKPTVEQAESPEPEQSAAGVLPPSQMAIKDAKPVDTTTKKFPVKVLAVVAAVVVLAGTVYGIIAVTNKKDTNKTATNTEVVKKDIPNIRYSTGNKGWESFYPGIDTSANYIESNVMVFEGLVRYENKTQVVPLLATGWTNPDDSTWVFNLKENVKFHTGRVMTPEDVKLSIEAAKSSDFGAIYSDTIKSVEVTGPNQVTIKTDGPDAVFLNKATNLYIFDTKSGKNNDAINGTGPFVVKPGTTPADESLELVAFDDYHNGHVYVRSFSFIANPTNFDGTDYGNNKADLMEFITNKPTLKEGRPYTRIDTESLSVFMMPLNKQRAGSPLQNLKVRQAMVLASDPLAIAAIRNVDGIPASQIIPQGIPGYNPTVVRPQRDVAKAKALLAEAGYPKGISLTFTYFAESQSTADEIIRQYAEAGITLKADPQAAVKDLAAKAFGGKSDIFFITATSDLLDATDIMVTYGRDTANYSNPEVTTLIDQASKTLDRNKHLNLLQQASKLLTDDVVAVPGFTPKSFAIIHDPSYVIQQDVSNGQLGVYFWKVYAK